MEYIDVSQGQFNFPSRDVPESQKDGSDYNRNYTKAIYNRYLNDKGGILYGSRDSLDMIRLYGKGAQPSSIYKSNNKEKANDSDTGSAFQDRTDKTRKGWENISWRPLSPLPRIKSIIKGYLDQVGQDVFIDAIDPISNDNKENIKWRMYVMAQEQEFLTEYHLQAGLPMEELEFLPVNQTELSLYESMGGFKMNHARVMEKLIRHTEDISDVDDKLKDRWIDDLVDLGVLCARLVFDPTINKYRYRYIDPKYLAMQFVQEDDYGRSEWAGYIEQWTISEVKQVIPGKPEDYWRNLASLNKGRLGNKGGGFNSSQWDNFSKHQKDGSYNYDSFKVEVLEAEWIDYEAQRNLYYVNGNGHSVMKPLGKDSVVKLTPGQKKRGSKDMRTQMRKLRGAKWVVGSDEVFDYGLVNMTDRPDKTNVMHSFRMYTLSDLPLTEQLIPIADDMAMAWQRWQDDRAVLQRSGYAIDVSMMENIKMGGDEFEFVDVLKAWRETRYLFHQQSMSGRYEGGQTSPAQPIPSLMLEAIQEFILTWDAAIKRIEDITGINLIMLGQTAPSGSQVTTTQMAASAASNVFKPIIKSVGRMKKDLAQTAMRRLQLAFKARPDIADSYKDVIGEADVELLKMAEKFAVQYGMVFEDKPDDEMKNDILVAAQASLQARRDGKPGIDISQYMYISQQLRASGNIKELTALLSYLNLKSERQIQQNKEKDIQLNNEGLAKIKQQEQQGEAQRLKGELDKIDREGMWDMKLEYIKQGAQNNQNSGVSPPSGTSSP